MLRITSREEGSTVTLVLEGKCRGPWVDELERCWLTAANASPQRVMHVNLEAVSFVDERGKELLKRMCSEGVRLVAVGPMMTSLVEEIATGTAVSRQV